MDDYGLQGTEGVTRFGNELAGRKDQVFIYNLNGQSISVKLK